MGRLEKQIIVGAIALVAVLLGVVVFSGVDAAGKGDQPEHKSEWGGQPLVLQESDSDDLKNGSQEEESEAARTLSLDGDSGSSEKDESEATGVHPGGGHQELEGTEEGPTLQATPSPNAGVKIDLEDQLRRYTVQPGDSLGEIAMEQLGSMFDVDLILEVNEGMTEKSTLQAGQEIWLPQRAEADRRRNAKKSAASAAEEAPGVVLSTSGKTHTVASGDSLWRIAEQYYGRENASNGIKEIVAANSKLKDENTVLNIGWKLVIP